MIVKESGMMMNPTRGRLVSDSSDRMCGPHFNRGGDASTHHV